MSDDEKKQSAYGPRMLARDEPGVCEPEFGLSNRKSDEKFCAAVRREIRHGRVSAKEGVKSAEEVW